MGGAHSRLRINFWGILGREGKEKERKEKVRKETICLTSVLSFEADSQHSASHRYNSKIQCSDSSHTVMLALFSPHGSIFHVLLCLSPGSMPLTSGCSLPLLRPMHVPVLSASCQSKHLNIWKTSSITFTSEMHLPCTAVPTQGEDTTLTYTCKMHYVYLTHCILNYFNL